MKLIEKQLGRTDIYKGRIIEVAVDDVELENGAKSKRELVMHPGGVCVAALTDREELLFVRQFRYPYQEAILELPAGKRSPGEDPLECGIRELKEETGAVASPWAATARGSCALCSTCAWCFWPPACPSATAIRTMTSSWSRSACPWRRRCAVSWTGNWTMPRHRSRY